MNVALHRMSNKVRDFIKDALAAEVTENSDQGIENSSQSRPPSRNNFAVAKKVRPPSGKRPDSGAGRRARPNSAIKIPQMPPGSRPDSGTSSLATQPSSARTTGRRPSSGRARPDSGKSTSSQAKRGWCIIIIVWQRFCELARLRIAYCPCVCFLSATSQ